MMSLPFHASSAGVSVAATAVVLPAVALPGSGGQIRIVSEGPNVCFVSLGASTTAATLPTGTSAQTCIAILPNSDNVFTRNPSTETYISTICRAAGSATLTVYTGYGV